MPFTEVIELEVPNNQPVEIYEGGIVLSVNSSSSIPVTAIDVSPPIGGETQLELLLDALYRQPFLYKVAAVALGGHRAVYTSSTGLQYASSEVLSHAGSVVGITTSATASGGVAQVQTEGEITESSWNWLPALPVFLGTNGLLKQEGPEPPDVFSQIIGVATSPTSILINIQQPTIIA